METEQLSDMDAFAVRQADSRFRSPGITRRHLAKEDITAYSVKNARRAKSTEPKPLDPQDPFAKKDVQDSQSHDEQNEDDSKRWSFNAKNQESMSKTELVNSYRLLMNEKLRLERFLSIMSKNHEMARNRLESDLLDAMMCIEDLKQALELRMARRRKIDPREAEERRYLIRQNKKLLNQLYESAKKIERLELTKVEMKEQLELLDFQILEVENQKAMMEEELRKLPSCNHNGTQTEDTGRQIFQLVQHLEDQIAKLESELSNKKAETAAALAKQHHLDSLVRELRRDNVDLRDQLAKIDDVDNSLAESDKPLAAGNRDLQSLLDTQTERVRELESKLKASQDYSDELESRLKTMDLFKKSHVAATQPATNGNDMQAAMHTAMEESGLATGLRVPRVDDLLLQETIRTFHALLAERDQELMQLKSHIRANMDKDDASSLILPELLETSIQTELHMGQAENLSQMADILATGGLILTEDQALSLKEELNRCSTVMSECDKSMMSIPDARTESMDESNYANLLGAVKQLRQLAESVRLHRTVPSLSNQQMISETTDMTSPGKSELEHAFGQHPSPTKDGSSNQTAALRSGATIPTDPLRPSSAPIDVASRSGQSDSKTPSFFSAQLQELREAGDLEVAKAHLNVSERRRQELERRVLEVTEDLARARAESRAAETSLSAARRTEAALRRRLLVAMDIQGSDSDGSNRHSLGLGLAGAIDTRDNLELQAALIKSEATNASLTEAAQLDRTRIHDQTMRIGQLEAEHRALMDRLSVLQANEASAQRGIVRLQALYEDMLREYSEARFQDLGWRGRDRSRSNFRNGISNGAEKKASGSGTHPTFAKMQQQIATLEEENQTLKLAVKQAEEHKSMVSSVPVGRCSAPACIEVRNLLKAFQDRFSDVMAELTRTQECLAVVEANSGHSLESPNPATPNTGLALATSTQKHFRSLQDLLENDNTTLTAFEIKQARLKLSDCMDSLVHLHRWLQLYARSTDAEIAQLRSTLLEMRISSMGGDQALVTCTNKTEQQPFSCSISLNRKPDMELLQQHEKEVQLLRSRVRDLEAELELTAPHYR